MNRFHQRRQTLPLPHQPGPRGNSPWRCWCLTACLLAGLASASGCQQPNGQLALPTNPMVGTTRVPAPPTGSVGANSGYAPGAYSQTNYGPQPLVGLPASDLMAQVAPPPAGSFAAAGSYAPTGTYAAASDFPPATHYAATPQYTPSPVAALQQAGYAETSASGPAVQPTISLAPQLRGMRVNDLTPAGQAPYLQAQAQLQVQTPLQAPSQLTPQAAVPTQPSAAWPGPSSTLTPLPAPPANLSPVPTAGYQDSWNVVGSGVAAPSTAPVAREASNSVNSSNSLNSSNSENSASQNLPWRAPTTAR